MLNINKFSSIKKRYSILMLIAIVFLISLGCFYTNAKDIYEKNLDFSNETHYVDSKGIPYVKINGKKIYPPTLVALYGLQYSGKEDYYEENIEKSEEKFINCSNWLVDNSEYNEFGLLVWTNDFDYEYKNIKKEDGWISALNQSVATDLLMEAYNRTNDTLYLDKAKEGIKAFETEIGAGGVRHFDKNDQTIWFEEYWLNEDNTTDAIGTHIRSINTINKLAKLTNDDKLLNLSKQAVQSLSKRSDLYISRYGINYDLISEEKDIKLDFIDTYSDKNVNLLVKKIELIDDNYNQNYELDFNSGLNKNDNISIISDGWDKKEKSDGILGRRLKLEKNLYDLNLKLDKNYDIQNDNEWLKLNIVYKDETKDNISVGCFDGESYYEILESDLLKSGDNQWKEWSIPIRSSDLGTLLSVDQANKYRAYLSETGDFDENCSELAQQISYFVNLKSDNENFEYKKIEPLVLPTQTTPIGYYFLDKDGVLMHMVKSDKSGIDESSGMELIYNPYLVAQQSIEGMYVIKQNSQVMIEKPIMNSHKLIGMDNRNLIKKENAYKWLNNNSIKVGDSYVWEFDYSNAYNDVKQDANWQSAFVQKYIIDAFMAINDESMVRKATNAYSYSTKEGGLSSFYKNKVWFEEVPNDTHIMNAHIASIESIMNVNKKYSDVKYEKLADNAINNLKDKLYLYDTGYWSRYDSNPKKELLFQLDILEGNNSPEIDEITLVNLYTNTATKINVGEENDSTGYPYISGLEWNASKKIDNKSTRSFKNGYEIHPELLSGGTRHNAYFLGVLPERNFKDYFEVPYHKVIIKYKDTSVSKIQLKTQAINEGNYLKFVPLKNSILTTTGDNQWKHAEFIIRPQDMGWYMGKDYQAYHVEKMQDLSNLTKDWYIEQTSKKWKHYLEGYVLGD